jgi:hypothetical protein
MIRARVINMATVLLTRSSVDLKLCWKESVGAQVRLIGYYRLDLGGLLRQRLIRLDSKPGHGRLRFFHASDNGIYLQTNLSGPRILLARFV